MAGAAARRPASEAAHRAARHTAKLNLTCHRRTRSHLRKICQTPGTIDRIREVLETSFATRAPANFAWLLALVFLSLSLPIIRTFSLGDVCEIAHLADANQNRRRLGSHSSRTQRESRREIPGRSSSRSHSTNVHQTRTTCLDAHKELRDAGLDDVTAIRPAVRGL